MFDRRRSWERLLLLMVAVAWMPAMCQGPITTTISDTVYRADGTPESGTLLISWSAFTTADNKAVAAGNKSVTLGSGGALSVALVPNAGASPTTALYTVVYHLEGGTVKTEYWVVPSSSPSTLAAVRAVLGEGGASAPLASRQYVDTSVATKANDAAVVHTTGSESIAGVKQFAASPVVPTPAQATDAANKGYVDAAVGSGGGSGGPFVSKAGDSMSGPLVLSGDPTAANNAADKHYVDLGLAGKADVVSGVVPRSELGSGTANGTLCLKGDATWGACGSSSNAVSIQSVGVDTATPTDNQVLTYDGASGLYKPKAGGGVTAGMQVVKYAIDFNWTQSPTTDLSTPGAKTVSLASCPPGVQASEPQYWVYVAGTGTAEAVTVTGGSCAGTGAAGTLQFTTLNAHTAGYTVSSASGGLQEALVAARISATNPSAIAQGGKVIAPPGELKLYARVSVRTSDITVDFTGSIVECYMNDVCLFAGDPTNSTTFSNITMVNPRGRPTIANGQNPFIEVNAQKTRLINVATRTPLSGGTFGTYVRVDDDQSFLLDGLDTGIGSGSGTRGVRCDATVCNPIIYAPGPFNTFSAVGWLKHLNLTLGTCFANGIDWRSGNTLHVSDSVIEGYAQYAIRLGGNGGNVANDMIDNVYMETANGCNPAGNVGSAGIVSLGEGITVNGAWNGGPPGPGGQFPTFASTGTTLYGYYVVAHDSVLGATAPLFAGNASSNGTGSIAVSFPCVASSNTITYDLLRFTWISTNSDNNPAPYGTGSYGVATGIAQGSGSVCTTTDTNATPASYTVAIPSFFPRLDYWPGGVVLSAPTNSNTPLAVAHLRWNGEFSGGVVSVAGGLAPSVFADKCYPWSFTEPIWVVCAAGDSVFNNNTRVGAMVSQIGAVSAGWTGGYKGREILEISGGANPNMPATDLYTLGDSNAQKTLSSPLHRPTWDANDTAIGLDQSTGKVPSLFQLGFRAPVSISNYVGSVFDNTSWKERLTASLKEFKTDVLMDANLTVTGAISGSISTATALAATPTQCSGSYATGIQANGNANCSTPAVIQLAETTPPTGIANYGIFWFDQTCHCPKVISNAGAAVQLGLMNVFNFDANTLEEYNGTTAQTLSIYGTRTDGSNYERLRLGYDTADSGYFVLASDALGSGAQHGLGFWLQGSKRWVIDPTFNLKPFADNVRDFGAATLRPRRVYSGTYVDTTSGAVVSDVANEGAAGTTLNKLAKLTGAPATAIVAATTDTSGVVGVVVDGAGITGSAQIARGGIASCAFDGVSTAGDYVQISSTTAGDCHDAGAGYPASGQVLGRVLSTNGASGTFAMLLSGPDVIAPATAAATLTSGTYLVGNGTSAVNVSGHLFDNGSNAIDLRNSTNPQTVNAYGTYTDGSNYERLAVGYVSGDGYYELQTQKAGTGAQRGIGFGASGGALGWAIDTNNTLKPFADNTRDFGTATLRPRDVYVGRNLIMSSTVSTYNGRATAGTGLAPIYGAVSSTGQTAAIGSASLCATSLCGAGQYVVNYYVDSTVACATPGSAAVSLTIGWTDETGAKTLQAPLNGTGVSGGNSLGLGATANFGSGDISLWSAGGAAVSYSTSYVACTSGTGTYAVRVTVRQVQ